MRAAAQLWGRWWCRTRPVGSVGLRWRRSDVNGGRSAGTVWSTRRGDVWPTDTRTRILHARGHVLAEHAAPGGGPSSSDIAADKRPHLLHRDTIYTQGFNYPQGTTTLLMAASQIV